MTSTTETPPDASSDTAAAQILTAETIPQYIQEHCWKELQPKLFPEWQDGPTPDMTVRPITGGNVNFAFCLEFQVTPTTTTSVFLKQAPEFVAIFGPDGYPLTSQRMQREINVYNEWKTLLGDNLSQEYLPQIYFFDRTHMVILMEFLDGYQLLDHLLIQDPGTSSPESPVSSLFRSNRLTSNLGDFLGRTHALTHASQVDAQRQADFVKQFENREMRDIQLEFVFTKCFKEATDEQRLGLTVTPEFLEQVELLKQQYNGTNRYPQFSAPNLVLTHGDFHPGSVMVHPTTHATKVIDPEFTVYGPPGLDVGSLLSGYILGAIHQAHAGHANEAQAIIEGARSIWNQYVETFEKVLLLEGKNDAEMVSSLIQIIAIESVGFAVAEVCRTALEFAGGRLWLQFDNVDTKAAAKKAALTLVQNCMIARQQEEAGGMELLWKEMERSTSSVVV